MGRKICVYGIAKNELHNVEAWLAQFQQADYIVIVDTGSTDGTVQELRSRAETDKRIHFHAMQFSPFRFDTARNVAMNLIPPDVDIAFTADFDERVSSNWYDVLASSNFKGVASIRLIFNKTVRGEVGTSYQRVSAHTMNCGAHWRYAVHEILMTQEPSTPTILDIDVEHCPDTGKDRSSYLELLHTMLEEYPDLPRTYQYLGREYFYANDGFQAIQYLRQHLEIETYGPFRSESCMMIAQAYEYMDGSLEGALDESEMWLYRAIGEFMHREPLYMLAQLYMKCGRYESARGLIATAGHVDRPSEDMVVKDYIYDPMYHAHMKATCEYNSGDSAAAKATLEEFLRTQPGNVTYPPSFMKDLMTIFGVEHEDTKGWSEEIPGDGEEGAESLPEDVPQVEPPTPVDGKRSKKQRKAEGKKERRENQEADPS